VAAWGERVFAYDLTELDGLDDLHAPTSVILAAEQLAARAFGAGKTCFLTAGATAGIIAGILACCGPGDQVLLPRNVHRSVIAGLLLADARPVFMMPEVDELTGARAGLEPRTVAAHLRDYPDARLMVLVNPTYYGACGDLAALVGLARDSAVLVLVDEAHGAHFPFWRGFPGSALAAGADVVVHGVHKTLGALTGGAMVHLGMGSRVPEGRLRSMLRLVHTTSPSYLTLASLDAARLQAATRGEAEWSQAAAVAGRARRTVDRMEGVAPHPPALPRPGYVAQDPFKLVVVSAGGWSGHGLVRELKCRGYYPELSEDDHVLLVLNPVNGQGDEELVDALVPSLLAAREGGALKPVSAMPGTIPPLVMGLRQAAAAPSRLVPLWEAAGRVAGELVVPYPPGTVAVCPGELITGEMVDWLRARLERGRPVHGVGPPPDHVVSVVDG
jgi:arginine decarboxylase